MNHERTHVDLFTGIGGFSIAARVNRVKTIAQCEAVPWLRKGLKKIWRVPCCADVRKFRGRRYFGVWLLTAGVPCQPASRAGDQQGERDVRWLWPEALRITQESQPDWALFENPPGIDDVGLGGIISCLEGIGYEVGICRIPACAVNSPQDRDRFWILAHRIGGGLQGIVGKNARQRQTQDQPGAGSEAALADRRGERPSRSRSDIPEGRSDRNDVAGYDTENEAVADGKGQRERSGLRSTWATRESGRRFSDCVGAWSQFQWITVPAGDGTYEVRRSPTGIYELAHGLSARLPRGVGRKLIAALGNSICWPVAAEIIGAMIRSEDER